MKTFLNVLYRRILYKIPLKRLLVGLAVFSVLLASFSSAENLPMANWVGNDLKPDGSYSYSTQTKYIDTNTNFTVVDDDIVFTCFHKSSQDASCQYSQDGVNWVLVNLSSLSCVSTNTFTIKGYCGTTYFYYFESGQGVVPGPMTSLECQTEYNLIPISSVDQNYCTTNNLCPTYDCPTNPIGTGALSNLYINNILHIGAPNIIMNIPEEIDWDYAYTAGGQNMNIDVFGYNVDYEKVQSVIDLQNYKPTDDDFSEVISVLAPYSKIIIFFVVLFGLWAMIKKPFKSKKL